ncbi:MAG: hypothetical protein JXA11_09455 [Phycisphaerae bacterium]|nr:hypothetical protein [Phycisphaerae bacterium]
MSAVANLVWFQEERFSLFFNSAERQADTNIGLPLGAVMKPSIREIVKQGQGFHFVPSTVFFVRMCKLFYVSPYNRWEFPGKLPERAVFFYL